MDAKTLCLAVLSQGDASGYEIRKAVESGPFGHIQDIGYSSIYPALSRLLEDGLVSVTEFAQEGRMSLLGALQEPTEPDKTRSDFLFRMLFADILPPSVVEQMIDERLREIEGVIARTDARAETGFESAGEAFLNGFAAAVQKAMADYLEENRYQLVGSSLVPQRAVAE